MKYLAFLRGINVGGHNVKMDQLRAKLTRLGLTNVRTYIQSGNVAFESDKKASYLEVIIEAGLLKHLGYAVPTYVRSVKEVTTAITEAPFVDDPPADVRQLVMFTKNDQIPAGSFPISSAKGDCTILGRYNREVYVRWLVDGRPPDTSKFFKDTFGSVAAAGSGRFYHTLKKLLLWAESA